MNRIVIVGQGLAGTLLAFELLSRNINIVIFDKGHQHAASSAAAGLINPINARHVTKTWMADELLEGLESHYANIENLLKKQFYFPAPIVQLLEDTFNTNLWDTKMSNSSFENSIGVSEVPEGLNAFAAGEIRGGGFLNIKELISESRAYFLKQNILSETEFNEELSKEYKKDKVVFCTGYRIEAYSPFSTQFLKPVKGEWIDIQSNELPSNKIIKGNAFVIPQPGHVFRVGATYDWNNLDYKTTPEAKELLMDKLEKMGVSDAEFLCQYAGIRPATQDRRPVLGEHPLNKGAFIFNGFGSKGGMLIPYFAVKMADFLLSETPLSDDVKYQRFIS